VVVGALVVVVVVGGWVVVVVGALVVVGGGNKLEGVAANVGPPNGVFSRIKSIITDSFASVCSASGAPQYLALP